MLYFILAFYAVHVTLQMTSNQFVRFYFQPTFHKQGVCVSLGTFLFEDKTSVLRACFLSLSTIHIGKCTRCEYYSKGARLTVRSMCMSAARPAKRPVHRGFVAVPNPYR